MVNADGSEEILPGLFGIVEVLCSEYFSRHLSPKSEAMFGYEIKETLYDRRTCFKNVWGGGGIISLVGNTPARANIWRALVITEGQKRTRQVSFVGHLYLYTNVSL